VNLSLPNLGKENVLIVGRVRSMETHFTECYAHSLSTDHDPEWNDSRRTWDVTYPINHGKLAHYSCKYYPSKANYCIYMGSRIRIFL